MPQPLRVLLVEDCPADAELVLHELRQADFAPDWQRVDTEDAFLAALDPGLDVILSDYSMPAFSTTRVQQIVQERGIEVPLIIVSGTVGEDTAVETMRSGAADYVLKDRLTRLAPAIRNAVEARRLRDSERHADLQMRLQAATMDAAAHGILIIDSKGIIQYVNPAFTTMTGYTRTEALGRTPRILKSGKHGPEFYRGLWETILAGKVWHGEMINKRKDGNLYPDLMTITPVRVDDGDITHFIAIHQDITEHKKLEAQFLQAQKMEAFGQLAGGVAHDFNNLLTVISGYTEMLLSGHIPQAKSPDLLGQIKQAADRAAGLTSQLLAFSRKQVLQPQVVDLNALVKEQQKMLRRLIGEDVTLTVECAADLHRVHADPGQLQQVILNLAVNARDAMPKGGLLTIVTRNLNLDESFSAAHPKAQPGAHVLLEVSDTGCGMTPEVLARIFEPFFTTKGVGKGTGLGLATVLGIVDQSGGFVDVHSQPEKGSTFRIYLPRTSAAGSGKHSRLQPAATAGGKETILLVEDDSGVRALAAMILRERGYHVLEASSGADALEVFRAQDRPIDLVLTDVIMPGMSGPEVARSLGACPRPPKVLYMSGYLDDAVVKHGILENELAFLQKPLSPARLLAKVREVLDAGKE